MFAAILQLFCPLSIRQTPPLRLLDTSYMYSTGAWKGSISERVAPILWGESSSFEFVATANQTQWKLIYAGLAST